MSEAGADDDGVVEHETQQGRYVRYNELLGQGRFKRVYRGFDERQGTDVAWAKIDGVDNGLSTEEMEQVLREVQDGQKLKHDNIINTHLVSSPLAPPPAQPIPPPHTTPLRPGRGPAGPVDCAFNPLRAEGAPGQLLAMLWFIFQTEAGS